MNKDNSDLSYNKVKLDYQTILTVTQQAVASAHLHMENYRRTTYDSLERIYIMQYKGIDDRTDLLRETISTKANAKSLVEMTERFAQAVELLHYLHGVIGRENIEIINIPDRQGD